MTNDFESHAHVQDHCWCDQCKEARKHAEVIVDKAFSVVDREPSAWDKALDAEIVRGIMRENEKQSKAIKAFIEANTRLILENDELKKSNKTLEDDYYAACNERDKFFEDLTWHRRELKNAQADLWAERARHEGLLGKVRVFLESISNG